MVKRPDIVKEGFILTPEWLAYLSYKERCISLIIEFCDIAHCLELIFGSSIDKFANAWGDALTSAFDAVMGVDKSNPCPQCGDSTFVVNGVRLCINGCEVGGGLISLLGADVER